MEVHVSLVGRKDLTGETSRQPRRAILDGRPPPGSRLPATRELARRLNVSRTTVTVAYDRLTGEGFIPSRVGAGPFVGAHVAGPGGGRGGHGRSGKLASPRPCSTSRRDSISAPGSPTPPCSPIRAGGGCWSGSCARRSASAPTATRPGTRGRARRAPATAG